VEAIFAEIVGRLEPRARMILTSYYFLQVPVKEIAGMLGIAEHAAYRELRTITGEISKLFEEKDVTADSLPEGVRLRLEAAL
jgi:DNA-directed RNA polymerase specialized sigma subunit